MKLSTQVWTRMESKGRPQDTKVFHGTVRDSAMHIAGWLSEVYMGSRIVITMARTESELEESKRGAEIQDMLGELDGLLADRPMQCPHGKPVDSACADCKHEHDRETA